MTDGERGMGKMDVANETNAANDADRANSVPSMPTPRRADWLLLIGGSAFKFSLVGFYLVAVMTILKSYGYSLEQLSWIYLIGAVEIGKALFSTLIERFRAPAFGRFRFWLLLSGAGIGLTLAAYLAIDLRRDFRLLLVLCLSLSLMSILYGCALLALSGTLLPFRERGFGGVIQVIAARGGKMIGGGLVLWIFQRHGWHAAVGAMTLFCLIVWLQTLLYREPTHIGQAPLPEAAFTFPALMRRMARFWRQTAHGARWFTLLIFSCAPYAFIMPTMPARLSDMGHAPQQVGAILAVWLPIASMLTAPFSGLLMRCYQRDRLMGALLGAQIPLLAACIFMERLSAIHPGLGVAQILLLSMGYTLLLPLLLTLILDKADPAYAALDSALQFSVLLIGTYAAGFASLRVAAWLGYAPAYAIATTLGLLLWLLALCSPALFAAGNPGNPAVHTHTAPR